MCLVPHAQRRSFRGLPNGSLEIIRFHSPVDLPNWSKSLFNEIANAYLWLRTLGNPSPADSFSGVTTPVGVPLMTCETLTVPLEGWVSSGQSTLRWTNEE